MCHSMKLLMTLLALVAAQQDQTSEASEGSCLLAKKKTMGKISLIQEESLAFEQLRLRHGDWRIRHLALEKKVNKSQDILDRFIKAQSESSDFCSSRLMESKRILDGILKDVHTINSQVKSHEAVLDTETENLKITKLSIDAVETEYERSIKVCKEERFEAEEELKKYSSELEELNQIANPSVRADISHSVKIEKSSDSDLSLLEVRLDKKMCEAFLDFAQRHEHRRVVQDPAKRDCDKQREELQEAFEKAYKETRELKEMARKRSVDKTCFEIAETTKTSELVPLVSQRDVAVEKIGSASAAIAAIEPVLKLVKDKAEKLRTHISETLTPECEEAGEASKLLVEVRKLIISLEECPGRNDFKLKIPSEDDEAESPEVTPEATDEENEGPKKTEEYIKKQIAEEEKEEAPKEGEKEEAPKEEEKEEAPKEANNSNNDNNNNNNNNNNDDNNNNNNKNENNNNSKDNSDD